MKWLDRLWGHICWKAWDYARKRGNARKAWRGESVAANDDMSPDQRRILANEARQLLDNPHFRQAFSAVDAYLEQQAHSCNPDDKDRTQRIIIGKQMLQAVRREVIRKLDDGVMAEVQIAEIERKRGLLRFQR